MAVAGGFGGGGNLRGRGVLRPVRGFINDLPKAIDAKRNIRKWFTSMMLRAETIAKSRAPVLTGALRASINGAVIGTNLSKGSPLQGRLAVGVVYGRRQEWEHRSRAFYAYFSLLDIAREIEGVLDGNAASVWIGSGRGYKGTMSFNPGISTGPTFGSHARTFEEGVQGGGVAGSGKIGPGGI